MGTWSPATWEFLGVISSCWLSLVARVLARHAPIAEQPGIDMGQSLGLLSITVSVFKIRSETCWTDAQFFQNFCMVTKESLLDRLKFCRWGSAVQHWFWRLLFEEETGNTLSKWMGCNYLATSLQHSLLKGCVTLPEICLLHNMIHMPWGWDI